MTPLLLFIFVCNIFLTYSAPDQYYALDPENSDDDGEVIENPPLDKAILSNERHRSKTIPSSYHKRMQSMSERTGHYIYKGQSPQRVPSKQKAEVERSDPKMQNEKFRQLNSHEYINDHDVNIEKRDQLRIDDTDKKSFEETKALSKTWDDDFNPYNPNKDRSEKPMSTESNSTEGQTGENPSWSVASNGDFQSYHNLNSTRVNESDEAHNPKVQNAGRTALYNKDSRNTNRAKGYGSTTSNRKVTRGRFDQGPRIRTGVERGRVQQSWRFPADYNESTNEHSWSDAYRNTARLNQANRKHYAHVEVDSEHENPHARRISESRNSQRNSSNSHETKAINRNPGFSYNQVPSGSWNPIPPPNTSKSRDHNRDYHQYLKSKRRHPSSRRHPSLYEYSETSNTNKRLSEEVFLPNLRKSAQDETVTALHSASNISLNDYSVDDEVAPSNASDHYNATSKAQTSSNHSNYSPNIDRSEQITTKHVKAFGGRISPNHDTNKYNYDQSTYNNTRIDENSTKEVRLHTRENSSRNGNQNSVIISNTATPNAEYSSEAPKSTDEELINISNTTKAFESVSLHSSINTNNRRSSRIKDYNNRYRFLRNMNHRLTSNSSQDRNAHHYVRINNVSANLNADNKQDKIDTLRKLILGENRDAKYVDTKPSKEPTHNLEDEFRRSNVYRFHSYRKQNRSNELQQPTVSLVGLITNESRNKPSQESFDKSEIGKANGDRIKQAYSENRNGKLIISQSDKSNQKNAQDSVISESKLNQQEFSKLIRHKNNSSLNSVHNSSKENKQESDSDFDSNIPQSKSNINETSTQSNDDKNNQTINEESDEIIGHNITKVQKLSDNQTEQYNKEHILINNSTDTPGQTSELIKSAPVKMDNVSTDVNNTATSNNNDIKETKQSTKVNERNTMNEGLKANTSSKNDTKDLSKDELNTSNKDRLTNNEAYKEIKDTPILQESDEGSIDKYESKQSSKIDKSNKSEATEKKTDKNETTEKPLEINESVTDDVVKGTDKIQDSKEKHDQNQSSMKEIKQSESINEEIAKENRVDSQNISLKDETSTVNDETNNKTDKLSKTEEAINSKDQSSAKEIKESESKNELIANKEGNDTKNSSLKPETSTEHLEKEPLIIEKSLSNKNSIENDETNNKTDKASTTEAAINSKDESSTKEIKESESKYELIANKEGNDTKKTSLKPETSTEHLENKPLIIEKSLSNKNSTENDEINNKTDKSSTTEAAINRKDESSTKEIKESESINKEGNNTKKSSLKPETSTEHLEKEPLIIEKSLSNKNSTENDVINNKTDKSSTTEAAINSKDESSTKEIKESESINKKGNNTKNSSLKPETSTEHLEKEPLIIEKSQSNKNSTENDETNNKTDKSSKTEAAINMKDQSLIKEIKESESINKESNNTKNYSLKAETSTEHLEKEALIIEKSQSDKNSTENDETNNKTDKSSKTEAAINMKDQSLIKEIKESESINKESNNTKNYSLKAETSTEHLEKEALIIEKSQSDKNSTENDETNNKTDKSNKTEAPNDIKGNKNESVKDETENEEIDKKYESTVDTKKPQIEKSKDVSSKEKSMADDHSKDKADKKQTNIESNDEKSSTKNKTKIQEPNTDKLKSNKSKKVKKSVKKISDESSEEDSDENESRK